MRRKNSMNNEDSKNYLMEFQKQPNLIMDKETYMEGFGAEMQDLSDRRSKLKKVISNIYTIEFRYW